MSTRSTRTVRVGVAAVVLALAVALVLVVRDERGAGQRHLTATFASTVNLYRGAQVKVLGVRVGEVTSVHVEGSAVRVQISYDDDVTLPADVHAMIVPPSIVGDRFVQLAPAYTGGKRLPDGATLALDHTEVPVELDQTYRQLDQLASALGPQGADQHGALSRLVQATAATLDGNGRRFNRNMRSLGRALDTLAATDPAYQDTIGHAAQITHTLLTEDGSVRRLVLALARVSGQLNAQRDDISRAATDLSGALRDVSGLIRANRAAIRKGVSGLSEVSSTLTKRIHEIQDLLALAPVGFVSALNINLPTNYRFGDGTSPAGRTTSYMQRGIFTGNLGVELSATLQTVCQSATGSAASQLALFCSALAAAGNDLGVLLTELTQLQSQGQPVSRHDLLAALRAASGVGR